MFGFPELTEVGHIPIPKKSILIGNNLNNEVKKTFDRDIYKIFIDNEITSLSINLPEGENIKSFYVVSVILKNIDFDEKNIILINKLIKQNMLLVLNFDNQIKLAVCINNCIYQTNWDNPDNVSISLVGLSIETVWENLVSTIAGFKIIDGRSLKKQIEIEIIKNKIQKKIKVLEKKKKLSSQPSFKQDYHRKIIKLKNELLELK